MTLATAGRLGGMVSSLDVVRWLARNDGFVGEQRWPYGGRGGELPRGEAPG